MSHEEDEFLDSIDDIGLSLEAEGDEEYKVSEDAAGYMELKGAEKDGSCAIVNVEEGISKEKGCCNLFRPKDDGADAFRCGNCFFEK